MKMMIIEDDSVSSMKMEAILSEYGQCVSFDNGEDALAHLKEQQSSDAPFNLITVDYVLPGICGPEIIKKIREIEGETNKPVSVALASSIQDEMCINKAISMGCDSFIEKPFTPDKVKEVIGMLKQ